MKYLLDTNAIVALLKGHARFLDRLRQHEVKDFALSAIVLQELYYGAFRSERRDANLQRIARLPFQKLDLSDEDAWRGGVIRAGLAAAGRPIGPYDVLIAGQAAARNLTLITRNTREFIRVEGLRFEDWEGGT